MERYGVKPERFSKAWFLYIWDYYKIHIIVGIVILAAIIYTVIAINSKKEYDLTICFSGQQQISEESKSKIIDELKKHAKDIDGDGEVNIAIYDYPFIADYDDIEYKRALEEKFHLDLQAGETFLYIVSKDVLDSIKYRSEVDGLFENPSRWIDGAEPEWDFGHIENSRILKESGILGDDLYIGLRNYRYSESEEKDGAKRDNAKVAGKAIFE